MRWQSLLVNRPGQFGPTMRIATLLLQDAEPSIIVHCILQSLHQRCKPPTQTLPSVKPTHDTDFTTLAHPTIPQPIFANRTIDNTQTYLSKSTSQTPPCPFECHPRFTPKHTSTFPIIHQPISSSYQIQPSYPNTHPNVPPLHNTLRPCLRD